MSCKIALKSVPVIGENSRCPICNQKLQKRVECPVLLYNVDKTMCIRRLESLVFCPDCKLLYLDGKTVKSTVNASIKFQVNGFHVRKGMRRADIIKQMQLAPTFSGSIPANNYAYTTMKSIQAAGKYVPVSSETEYRWIYNPCANRRKVNTTSETAISDLNGQCPTSITSAGTSVRSESSKEEVPICEYEANPFKGNDTSEYFKHVYITNHEITYCPFCHGKLEKYYNFVPIELNGKALCIPGMHCPTCNIFINCEENLMKHALLKFNAEANCLIDRTLFIPDFQKVKDTINRLSSAVLAIFLKSESGSYTSYIIIQDNRQQDFQKNILYYRDETALYLLLGVVKQDTDLILNGEKQLIIGLLDKNGNQYNSNMQPDFLLKKVYIHKYGGMNCPQDINQDEKVDVLLYSPFLNKLKIWHASFNRGKNIYYMDSRIYRNFVKYYGNPGIKVFGFNKKSGVSDSYMQEESLLHAYGYNVSKSKGISKSERHQLLAEIMDLELMTQSSIYNLLCHNIELHEALGHFQACNCWREDIEFVLNYNINPDRFIIAKNQHYN